MDRKLASIQKVREITPIDGADSIEIASVNSWKVVVKKGEFKIGDLCVYCEIDSFLPMKDKFEFLRRTSYKKMANGAEGFRLRTIKLKGQISQGLLLPLNVLNDDLHPEMSVGYSDQPWGEQLQLGPYDDALLIGEGLDVTKILGIIKYEHPIPAELSGKVKGPFPDFLRKTDEERVQNLTESYDRFRGEDLFATEKLDGSSATFYLKDGEFGVCSRNLELFETSENTFWKVARQLHVEEKLRRANFNCAFQGELIGEGIQGNPYKIKGQTVKIFNIYNIDSKSYLGLDEMNRLLEKINTDGPEIELVPILQQDFNLPPTIEKLLEIAEGMSELNPAIEREGLVIRNGNKSISFKAISNSFLLNLK